jgi:hypothetical protein
MTTEVSVQPRRWSEASQKRKFVIEAIAVAAIALILVVWCRCFYRAFGSTCWGGFWPWPLWPWALT